MAAASPSARRRAGAAAEGGAGGRPLSAALLLASAPDPGGGGGGGGARDDAHRAFENVAFELGSPERPPAPTPAPAPSDLNNNSGRPRPRTRSPTPLDNSPDRNANNNGSGDDLSPRAAPAPSPAPAHCVNGNVFPTAAAERASESPRPAPRARETHSAPELSCERRRASEPSRPLAAATAAAPAAADARAERPSWLLEGATRLPPPAQPPTQPAPPAGPAPAEAWRRRRTDPAGDSKYYHRDYREALSSLLWQPYDCRDQSNQTSTENVCSLDDDADVALWLYPPPATGVARRGRLGTAPAVAPAAVLAPGGRASSSASSASSVSSGSCSGWRAAAEGAWGRGGGFGALPAPSRAPRPGNVPVDPNPRAEDVVSDLHTPWLGTTTTALAAGGCGLSGGGGGGGGAGARAGPPAGALASRGAEPEVCELCCGPQCTSDRPASASGSSGVRAADSECCLCCAAQDAGPTAAPADMLVTVDASGAATDAAGAGTGTGPRAPPPPLPAAPALAAPAAAGGNSVSVVNCYRAVPVVVSAVPTIPCLNSSSSSNNVCNVNIVQTTPAEPVRVSASSEAAAASGTSTAPRGRTFTSTEAQTDDFGPEGAASAGGGAAGAGGASGGRGGGASGGGSSGGREQRRRERRERRQQRRLNAHGLLHAPPPHPHEAPPPPPPGAVWQTQLLEPHLPPGAGGAGGGDRLPDILNSHLPPPYSTLPVGLARPPPPPPPAPGPPHPHAHPPLGPPPPPPPPVAVPVALPAPGSPPPQPPHHHPGGMRFPFQLTPSGRRRFLLRPPGVTVIGRSRGHHYTPEEEPKSCCGVVVTQTVSIRWFIVMIAFVGICCAVVGTVLGAMKASGREHLTVSLLMIGVGIVLITVSGVAWRLTAHDAPSCRVMLGLGGGEDSGAEPNRRFVPRLPPSYGRPHHPYAAMMYPEFQYRPPPPSYQASMQEYRLRLLLLDRHPGGSVPGPGQTTGGHMVSPPPTYRSHAGSTLSRAPLGLRRDQMQSDYSRPPSYRSRTSSTRPTLDPNGNMGCSTAEHSRDPSLSLSESGGGSAVVNVISVMGNGGSEAENLDNIKMLPDQEVPLRMMLNKGCHSSHMNVRSSVDEAKDANLVTIVQTGNDTSPVIVTVSGSTMATTTGSSTSASGVDTEMEILAHL